MPKKILLADDSITIQKVITITFAAEDYELTIAGDGESAIEKAKAIKPDLVMADVAMPGKNGYQVCDYIKKDPSLTNTPVILLSGTFEPLNKEEAARVKADANIVKPFESQELTERVKELLAKSAASREAVVSQPVAPPPPAAAAVPPPAPEKKPEPQIWEAKDFVSFTEETEEKSELPEPSLDFLEGLEGGPMKEDLTEDFMDLGPLEEEKPRIVEPPAKKEEAPAFDLGTFETEEFKPEPFKAEPIEFVPPAEPVKPAPEAPRAAAFAEEPVKPEELPWFAPEKPAGTGIPETAKAVAEEPQEETDLLEVPPELIEEKIPVEPRVHEIQEAAPQVTKRIVEEVAGRTEEKVEEKIKEGLSGRFPAGVTLPKEQLEEIVQKVAREVIEEIAWEVVPELAEDLIKAEINKFKEAISKLK